MPRVTGVASHLARPVLGVDDEDSGRRDGEVIDVAAAPRHAAIVKQDRRPALDPLLQGFSDGRLACGAPTESGLVLRLPAHGEQGIADDRVRCARPRLALDLAALVSRVPRAPRPTLGARRVDHGVPSARVALKARDTLLRRVPPRLDARVQATPTCGARVGSTKT